MYCQRCYEPLADVPDCRCPRCGLGFDPQDRRTYLKRPFPRARTVVWRIILTTILGILVAFVVATFQAAQLSGH